MVNFRFLSTTTARVIGLICASVCAWYMGYLFAELLPEDSLQSALQIGQRPVLKAPPPMKQKCAVWRTCPATEAVYRVRSGASRDNLPEICVDDKILLGSKVDIGNRGINFAIVNRKTMEVTDTKAFDMYEGDFSGPMVEFIKKIPDGSIILVASHDEASSKLTDAAKKAFEDLGSKEIRNIKFRSQWVFMALKGGSIPENLEREKIIHSGSSNRYGGWPAEIQIDGCLPKN